MGSIRVDLGDRNNENLAQFIGARHDVPILMVRVNVVDTDDCEWVAQHFSGRVERDSMF